MRSRVLRGGVCGISHARVISVNRTRVDPATGGLVTHAENVVDTEGSALMRIATREWADWERTTTNDVCEVARVLGLAAARAVLYAELDRVVSYDGGYIDGRHMSQVVASMTHRGFLMPFTRHGINNADFHVVERASYEQPVETITGAAQVAAPEPLRSMSECVAFGQRPAIGTGTVAVQDDVAVHRLDQDERLVVASREQRGMPGQGKLFRKRLLGAGFPRHAQAHRSSMTSAAANGNGNGNVNANAGPRDTAAAFLERHRRAMMAKGDDIVRSVLAENGVVAASALAAPSTALAPTPAPAPAPAHGVALPYVRTASSFALDACFGVGVGTGAGAGANAAPAPFRPSSPTPAMLAQLSACSAVMSRVTTPESDVDMDDV
jgi:hypothetical protein